MTRQGNGRRGGSGNGRKDGSGRSNGFGKRDGSGNGKRDGSGGRCTVPFGTNFQQPTIFDASTRNALDIFDSVFKDFFGKETQARDMFENKARYPKADVTVYEDQIVFDIAIPGLSVEDVEVDFLEKTLSISSSTEKEDKEGINALRELSHSNFKRSWNLSSFPLDISEEQPIQSSLKNGVLTITVPLVIVKEPEPTKINIIVED